MRGWTNIRSLQLKIALLVGGILLAVLAVLVSYAAVSLRRTSEQAVQDRVMAVAQSEARAIKAEVEMALDAARTMAQTLTAIKDDAHPLRMDRQDVNAMLRQVLVQNPQLLGTYTLWEPNAFDGRDTEFINAPIHDETGRLIPYWVRDPDGSIHVEAIVDYETEGIGDWYLIPKRTHREVIIDPYLYSIENEQVLMTSLVVPVIWQRQFYGVVGTDFRVDFMQKLTDQLDIYNKTGKMALISYQGILAGVTGQAELIGRPVTEMDAFFDAERLARVQNGDYFVHREAGYLKVYVPLGFGQTETPWCVNVWVPVSEMNVEAMRVVWGMLGVSMALAALAMVLLWWAAAQIVRPIRQITATALAVSGGDFSVQARVESQDEVGVLAGAFNQMTRQLADSIALLEQRVAERTRGLQAAAEVSQATTSVLDMDTLLYQVVNLVQERFGLYYVGLFLVDQEQQFAVLSAGTGEAGQQMLAQGWKLQVGGQSMIGRCVSTGRADIQLDVGAAPVRFDNPFLPQTHSEMAIPLRARGRVIGAMTVQSAREAAFDESDIAVMQTMADQVATAIDNARLFAEAQAALEQVQAAQRRYLVQVWSDYARASGASSYELTRSGAPLPDEAVLDEARQAAQQRDVLARQGSATEPAALVTPILVGDQVIGVLGIHDQDADRRWSEHDIALVRAAAERMGQAAESLRLLDETQRNAARERMVTEVVGRVRETLDLEVMLQTAVQEIQRTWGVTEAAIRIAPQKGDLGDFAPDGLDL